MYACVCAWVCVCIFAYNKEGKKFFYFFQKGVDFRSGKIYTIYSRNERGKTMKAYAITAIRTHKNEGINKQQSMDFFHNGRTGRHDNLKWYETSDLPEQSMSVKSARFSLCAGGQLKGKNIQEMLDDYFARVASIKFTYVTCDYVAYEMDAKEFRAFLECFGTLEKESTQNGGKIKVKAKSESKEMLKWLKERA